MVNELWKSRQICGGEKNVFEQLPHYLELEPLSIHNDEQGKKSFN